MLRRGRIAGLTASGVVGSFSNAEKGSAGKGSEELFGSGRNYAAAHFPCPEMIHAHHGVISLGER